MKKLKTKTIPCLVMLIGGCTVTVISLVSHYPSKDTLRVLLITLLACYFIGTLIKVAMDKIELKEDEEIEDEDQSNSDSTAKDESIEDVDSEDEIGEALGESAKPMDLESFIESDDMYAEDIDPEVVAPQYEEQEE